jgi:hypothetical protein
MTSASRLSRLLDSLSSVTRGKLVRCVNTVARAASRASSAHNRGSDIADETNARYHQRVCVAEQQKQHHDPRDFQVISI